MTKRILVIIGLSFILCTARADQFQLTTSSGDFNLSYLKVEISRDGKSIFSGRTDKIGRIEINLEKGVYPAQLQDSQGNKKAVNFEINGDSQLRIVPVD
jgi:hypothetical protein